MKIYILILFLATLATAAEKSMVKTKSAAKNGPMSFDNQLVEGQIYRPDLSVVTGDTSMTGTGVIRLRKNFYDHEQFETQQEIK